VIIHVKYTARDGGDALRANATTSLAEKINKMLDPRTGNGLMRIFSAKNDLATEWYRFLNPVNTADDQVLALNLDSSRFPLFAQGKQIKINRIELAADCTATPPVNLKVVTPAGDSNDIQLNASNIYGSYLSNSIAFTGSPKAPGNWVIKNPQANARLKEDKLKNLVIIVYYEISA
jgi:hypothetical protein